MNEQFNQKYQDRSHAREKREWSMKQKRGVSLVTVYAVALVVFSVYTLLDTFVIPRTYASAETVVSNQNGSTYSNATSSNDAVSSGGEALSDDTTGSSDATPSSNSKYSSDATSSSNSKSTSDAISSNNSTGSSGTTLSGDSTRSNATAPSSDEDSSGGSGSSYDASASGTDARANATSSEQSVTTDLSQYRYLDTTIYVVDVYTSDPSQLLTALANDSYGRNITATTSQIAEAHDATVAINGDFYGARNAGYVIRNGVLFRDKAASSDQEDLVIYSNGTMAVVSEGTVSAQQLLDDGAWQVFSFGPGLVVDGVVSVDANDEVGRAMASNPRTAIGQVSDGHYVLVVADGRTSESVGLSLQELATFMKEELGVTCAYNLDGGGSSTLWYQGSVVNNPTSGHGVKERSVSDIVYIAG